MTKEQLSDSRSLLSNPLVTTEDFLLKFAECSQFTFSAKDIKSRKIFIHNKVCAELYGLPEKGLVGMTSRDCLEQNKLFTDKDDALTRWEKEEVKAITHNAAQTNVITILDYDGFVRVREHLTIPISGTNKQIASIAAFCYDRTKQIDLLTLFAQYQKFYPKNNQATLRLSQYLGITEFFQFRLTLGELYTLLALTQAPRHKRAAYLLSSFRQKVVAPATLSGYVERIRDKLKPCFNLERVLSHLRGLNQWIPNPDIF